MFCVPSTKAGSAIALPEQRGVELLQQEPEKQNPAVRSHLCEAEEEADAAEDFQGLRGVSQHHVPAGETLPLPCAQLSYRHKDK